MGADGSAPRPLLALPGDERYPSLSPDGDAAGVHDTRVGRGRRRDRRRRLPTARARRRSPTTRCSTPHRRWSPDGRRIAFERGPAGRRPGQRRLVDGRGRRRPAAAHDDRRSRRGPGLVAGRVAHRVHEHPRRHQRHLDDGRRRRRPAAADDAARQGGVARLAGAARPAPPAPPGSRRRPWSRRPPSPRSAPKLSLRLTPGQSLRTLARRGSSVSLRCSRACTADARLLLDRSSPAPAAHAPRPLTIGHATRRLRAGTTTKLTIRLSSRTRHRLAAGRRVALTLKVTGDRPGPQADQRSAA